LLQAIIFNEKRPDVEIKTVPAKKMKMGKTKEKKKKKELSSNLKNKFHVPKKFDVTPRNIFAVA
jgi:hypothetical protein